MAGKKHAELEKLIKTIKGVGPRLSASERNAWGGTARTDFPEPMMDKVVEKLEKIKKWKQNGIITEAQYKTAMKELEEVIPGIQRQIAKIGVTGGDVLEVDDVGPKGMGILKNPYFDQKKAGNTPARNIPLEGARMPQVKASGPGPKLAGMLGTAGSAPPINLKESLLADDYTGSPSKMADEAGRVKPREGGWLIDKNTGRPVLDQNGKPIQDPTRKRPGFALDRSKEIPTPSRFPDSNPDPKLRPSGMLPVSHVSGTNAMSTNTTRGAIPPTLMNQTNASESLESMRNNPNKAKLPEGGNKPTEKPWRSKFDIAKAGKLAGKAGRGLGLGAGLMMLDYMKPDNAVAQSREEGYGLMEDMGLDVAGGIDSIENPWIQGGAGLLDGLIVDPAMTAAGGAKKFKEMISRDIKAARKRRKDRKPDFKPKTYRGSKGRKLSLI